MKKAFHCNTRALRGLIGIGMLITFALLSEGFAQSQVSKNLREAIVRDANQLTIEGGPEEAAEARLRSYDRKELIAALRSLSVGEEYEQVAAFRTIIALDIQEMKSDVAQLVRSSQSWRVIHTLNKFLQPDDRMSFGRVYLSRLQTSQSTSEKIAVLEGLKAMQVAFSSSLYQSLLVDESHLVRIEALQHFLATRKRHTYPDQTERFRESFKAKPYQVRLEAMYAFSELPERERAALRGALDANLCVREPNSEVKEMCARLVQTLSRSKSTGSQ